MSANTRHDDDLPNEIDFAKAQRGKVFRQGKRLRLPLYPDDPLPARLAALAETQGGRTVLIGVAR